MKNALAKLTLAALTWGCANELSPVIDSPNEESQVNTYLSLPER